MEGKATGSEVKIFYLRYFSTRCICMWRQNTTTNPTQIPTQLVTCGPPRVISLIKDNMLLLSVSFLEFFFKQDIEFFFHFFGKKVWRSWPAAQELRPHSSKCTQMYFVSWPELVCALLWHCGGRRRRECVSGWEMWARKCLLFLQEGEHSASAGQGGGSETTAVGSPRKISC